MEIWNREISRNLTVYLIKWYIFFKPLEFLDQLVFLDRLIFWTDFSSNFFSIFEWFLDFDFSSKQNQSKKSNGPKNQWFCFEVRSKISPKYQTVQKIKLVQKIKQFKKYVTLWLDKRSELKFCWVKKVFPGQNRYFKVIQSGFHNFRCDKTGFFKF